MTILSKSEFLSQVQSLLADNSTRQISPYDLRKNFTDLVDSIGNIANGSEINSKNFGTPETRSTIAGKDALRDINLSGRTSVDNSAIGYATLRQNYNGSENTAVGSLALACNLVGKANTAVGLNSNGGNITGSGNTSLGANSLTPNKFGDFNIAIGYGAGFGAQERANYKFYLGVNTQASGGCDVSSFGDTTPLLYGDLKTRQLGISVESFVGDEALRSSGDIIPSINQQFSLGTSDYKWDGYFNNLHVCNLTYDCDPDVIEGFLIDDISAPSGFCYPTSGLMRVKLVSPSGELDGGSCTDGYDEVVINRDATLAVSGCSYIIAKKINHEYRPIWVGCSGYCSEV